MATPVTFPEQTTTFLQMPGDDGPLPAFRDESEVSISKWRLSWRERFRALLTGTVWLHCHGSQPGVYVSGEYPFQTWSSF